MFIPRAIFARIATSSDELEARYGPNPDPHPAGEGAMGGCLLIYPALEADDPPLPLGAGWGEGEHRYTS